MALEKHRSRMYFFGNMYLSSIQQGIQAGHVIAELTVKYAPDDTRNKMFRKWAMSDKVMILLNGGYVSNLYDIREVTEASGFPCADFSESLEAMDGMLTSVGVVVPKYLYTLARWIREYRYPGSNYTLPISQIEKNGTVIIDLQHIWTYISQEMFDDELLFKEFGISGLVRTVILKKAEYDLIQIINSCKLAV